MTTQPEALRLLQHINDLFVSQWGMNNPMAKDSKIVLDELRRLHEAHEWQYTMAGQRLRRIEKLEAINQELLAALRVAALAIHEYRTQGAPHAYWDDVEHQAAEAIAKAERTTT